MIGVFKNSHPWSLVSILCHMNPVTPS